MERNEPIRPHEPTAASSEEAVVTASTNADARGDRDVATLVERQHDEIRDHLSRLTDGGDPDLESGFCELRRLLAIHETAEEEILYPYVRAQDGGQRIAEAREREEGHAKDVLAELDDLAVDDPAFPAKMRELRTMVLAHAEAEERAVLPLLRAVASDEDRERMATAFRAAEAVAPTHPHPHAPDNAIGNIVAGPFLAIADRVRDAIHARSA